MTVVKVYLENSLNAANFTIENAANVPVYTADREYRGNTKPFNIGVEIIRELCGKDGQIMLYADLNNVNGKHNAEVLRKAFSGEDYKVRIVDFKRTFI